MPNLSRWFRGLAGPALAGAFLVLVVLPLILTPPESGALAAPRLEPALDGPVQVINLASAAIATTTTWTGGRWSALGTDRPPTKAEIWLTVVEPTVNTTTFVLQVSPDNSTWLAHKAIGTLASSVATNTSIYTATTIEGVYYRVVATVSNTQTLTPTIKVVLR